MLDSNWVGSPNGVQNNYINVCRTDWPEWDRESKFAELFFTLNEQGRDADVRQAIAARLTGFGLEWTPDVMAKWLTDMGKHQGKSGRSEEAKVTFALANKHANGIKDNHLR